MLELVIAPSGLGKTQHIIDNIKVDKKDSKIIVITPDQNSYNFERMLCESLGGTFNIDVVNFSRLYKKLNEIVDLDISSIKDTDKYFYYLELLTRLKDTDNFLIKRLNQDIEFIHVISDLIEELDEYGVTSEKLQEFIKTLEINNEKFEDLVIVYTEYKNILIENKEYTKQSYIETLVQCMENTDFSNYVFYIDGYYNFSSLEYKIIEQLVKSSKKVTISVISELDRYTNFRLEHLIKSEITKIKQYNFITLENIREDNRYSLDIYRKSHEIIAYINSMILKNNIKKFNIVTHYSETKSQNYKIALSVNKNTMELVSIKEYNENRFCTEELYYLQKEFSKLSKSYKETSKSNVVICESADIETEMKQLSRNISKEIEENNYKLKDIAILYRDEVYKNYSYILEGFGINVHIDEDIDTSNHRLIKLINNILNYRDENFKIDILNILKSNLVTIELVSENSNKLAIEDIEEILNYKLINTIQDLKKEYFEVVIDGYSSDNLVNLKNYLLNIADRINKLKKKKTINHFIKELFKILELLRIEERILSQDKKEGVSLEELQEKSINQQVMDKFLKLLEDLKKHGKKKISYDLFSKVVSILIQKITYRSIPQSEEYAVMSKIDLSKVENKKIIFLLGLNKEILPKTINSEGIIDDKDKYNLSLFGIELSPGSRALMIDEDFVAYIALTRSKEKLYISYSLSNSKYLPQKQSIYVDTIYKILDYKGGNNLKNVSGNAVIFNLSELTFYDILKNRMNFYSKLEILYYYNKLKYSRRLDISSKKYVEYMIKIYSRLIDSVGENNVSKHDIQEKINYIKKGNNNFSFSRLRRYEQNAFIYFIENILQISYEQDVGLTPVLVGTYKHAILENETLLRYINNKVEKFIIDSLEHLDTYIESLEQEIKAELKRIEEISKNKAIRQFRNIAYSQGINSYVIDVILESLVKSVEIEIYYRILSGYKINKTEKKFTLECTKDSVSLVLNNSEKVIRKLDKEYNVTDFKLSGVIDRIDEKDRQFLVVDYKSSKTDFEVERFYNNEVSQLLIYMLAILLLENIEVSRLKGVFFRELAKKDKDNKEFRLRGLINERLLKEINMISELFFVRTKKDGTPYANDQHKVYNDIEFEKLININIEYIYMLVEKIQKSQYNLESVEAEYNSLFNYVVGESTIIEKEYEKIQAKDFKKLIFE